MWGYLCPVMEVHEQWVAITLGLLTDGWHTAAAARQRSEQAAVVGGSGTLGRARHQIQTYLQLVP